MDAFPDAAAQRGGSKTARIPVKVMATSALHKPGWIRVRLSCSATLRSFKQVLREQTLNTVCKDPACPSVAECFSKSTVTSRCRMTHI